MNSFPILMLAFSGALFIYAGLLALTKDYKMLPFRSRQSVDPEDSRKYACKLAKVVALVAMAPALSGLLGFWNITVAVVVLLGGIAAAIRIGARSFR